MAKPLSLLEEAKAFARDFARDRMPAGYMWDLVDYVPALLDSQLTIRGPWKWASDVCPDDIEGGIYAPFKKGNKLVLVDALGNLLDCNLSSGAITTVGAVHRVRQNPVMHLDFLVVPHRDGTAVPKIIRYDGTNLLISDMHTSAFKGRYAAVYKGRTILANADTQEERIAFSPPGFADTDNVAPDNSGNPNLIPWDPRSYFNTSLPLTAIGALRAVILLFHEGSVERLRGGIPPSEFDPEGDMFMEPLYDRAGCGDARSVAFWQDNCVFADERGVHFTDGAIVRNLASQGGILSLWRTLYRNRLTIAADTYLDYYIVTVIRTDGAAMTLCCDLNRRAWIRLSNFRSKAYIHSIGAQEQLWGSREGSKRLASFSNCFFPEAVEQVIDDDGTPVLPAIETPWYRLSEEGRKRIRFVYTSYDARLDDAVAMAWRGEEMREGGRQQRIEQIAQEMTNGAKATLGQLLEVGYITSPHELDYTVAGHLPPTTKYERYRLPIGKHPYGVAFRIRQLQPTHITRLYDIAAEAQADERSRL